MLLQRNLIYTGITREESGRTHRTTEGTAYRRIEQQDAAPLLRLAGSVDISR
jgi:hypothetical protein